MSPKFEGAPGELADRLISSALQPSLTQRARSAEFTDGARAGLLQRLIGKPLACPHKEGSASADAFFAGANEGHSIYAGLTAEGQATSIEPGSNLAGVIEQCADRALARSCPDPASSDAALYFTALLGHELINQDIEVGVRLLDLVDASALTPNTLSTDVADGVLRAAQSTSEHRDAHWAFHFIGHIQGCFEKAGRPDIVQALETMAFPEGHA